MSSLTREPNPAWYAGDSPGDSAFPPMVHRPGKDYTRLLVRIHSRSTPAFPVASAAALACRRAVACTLHPNRFAESAHRRDAGRPQGHLPYDRQTQHSLWVEYTIVSSTTV